MSHIRHADPRDVEHVLALWALAGENDAMVLEGNTAGQALWEHAGFGPQERWRRWVRSTA